MTIEQFNQIKEMFYKDFMEEVMGKINKVEEVVKNVEESGINMYSYLACIEIIKEELRGLK